MKSIVTYSTLILALATGACASDQRSAANKLRAQFYDMQAKDGQYHAKIAAKAAEFNKAFQAIQQTCDSKQASVDTLACLPPAPPAPKPVDVPKDEKK